MQVIVGQVLVLVLMGLVIVIIICICTLHYIVNVSRTSITLHLSLIHI